MRDGGEHLSGADVRSADHADFAVRIRERGGPLDGVVTVIAFVLEGIPFAFGSEAAADVLNDDDVAKRRGPHAELGFAGAFVVRRALEEDRELTVGFGAVDVGAESDAVARFHGDVVFDGDVGGDSC